MTRFVLAVHCQAPVNRSGRLSRAALIVAALSLGISACSPANLPHRSQHRSPLGDWRPVEAPNFPAGVQLMSLSDRAFRLEAWAVVVDPAAEGFELAVVNSDDVDGQEVCSSFLSDDPEAFLVLNAGYFDRDEEGATPVGFFVAGGEVRMGRRIRGTPVAFGVDADGRADIAFARVREGKVFRWPDAQLADSKDLVGATGDVHEWHLKEAIQCVPCLMIDGEPWPQTNVERAPRTAVGLRPDGLLVFVVIDGRQTRSRGVTLDELATMMAKLGCVDAMNLDGGGSSTIVTREGVLNRPSGGTEREVYSAIVLRRPKGQQGAR